VTDPGKKEQDRLKKEKRDLYLKKTKLGEIPFSPGSTRPRELVRSGTGDVNVIFETPLDSEYIPSKRVFVHTRKE